MKTPPLFLLLCLASTAFAQVYTPPSNGGTPAPSVPADYSPAPQRQAPSSPLGQEIPMLDPSAETITIGGVAIPLGDNRLLKARFEKYLNQPPETDEDAAEYRKNIEEILGAVSPFRSGGPDLYSGFKLLPAAASYPGDANLCMSLAESIYMAMLAKNNSNALKTLNKSIEEEKQAIMRQADWDARNDRDRSLGESAPVGSGGGNRQNSQQPATSPGAGINSLKYKETLRRIAEIEALKKSNILQTEAQTIQTKGQYQVTMIQWFVQRRYEHVLMAARFYNQIWKDGDATLRIDKNSDVSKLFSDSLGISPTVASLDSLSNEVIREAEKYIEAFDLLLSRDELHSASQRLMEAYAIGEYLAPVATLPLEKKRRVAEYVRDLHELYGTLQARDYVKGKELADRLKTLAKDFPSSKVDSAIAAYTLASDLAIEEAKTHLIAREIAKRQYEFAPAIQGDATREDAFKQIMENLREIEGAIGKAGEFSRMGQNYGAWEQLAEIRERFPDDPTTRHSAANSNCSLRKSPISPWPSTRPASSRAARRSKPAPPSPGISRPAPSTPPPTRPTRASSASSTKSCPRGKPHNNKTSAGKERRMKIFFPEDHDPAKSKVPGVILFHGGGWSGGNLSQFRAACASRPSCAGASQSGWRRVLLRRR